MGEFQQVIFRKLVIQKMYNTPVKIGIRQAKKDHENPSVGLILCASKNDEVVEYAMSRSMSLMLVSEYKL